MTEMIGDLVSFIREGIPCIYIAKDGGFQYKMKYLLDNTKKEMQVTHLQLIQLFQLTITSLTSLFTAVIAFDGTLHDSGSSGHGKINLW